MVRPDTEQQLLKRYIPRINGQAAHIVHIGAYDNIRQDPSVADSCHRFRTLPDDATVHRISLVDVQSNRQPVQHDVVYHDGQEFRTLKRGENLDPHILYAAHTGAPSRNVVANIQDSIDVYETGDPLRYHDSLTEFMKQGKPVPFQPPIIVFQNALYLNLDRKATAIVDRGSHYFIARQFPKQHRNALKIAGIDPMPMMARQAERNIEKLVDAYDKNLEHSGRIVFLLDQNRTQRKETIMQSLRKLGYSVTVAPLQTAAYRIDEKSIPATGLTGGYHYTSAIVGLKPAGRQKRN